MCPGILDGGALLIVSSERARFGATTGFTTFAAQPVAVATLRELTLFDAVLLLGDQPEMIQFVTTQLDRAGLARSTVVHLETTHVQVVRMAAMGCDKGHRARSRPR